MNPTVSETTCLTCGSPVGVHTSDEGTSHYVPLAKGTGMAEVDLTQVSTAQLICELHARAEESQTMWDDFGTPSDSK